jgi:hypothetical protein
MQATADASQHFFGVRARHLSEASKDERHGVKHRLVRHGTDIPLYELDYQAGLVRSALGCSNACWSEIKACHQRAASSHRQAVPPAPAGNVQNALARA